jgi:hypothetical protein
MNTCLSTIYLKFAKIDPRHIRLALVIVSLFAGGGFILHLPLPGDVSG